MTYISASQAEPEVLYELKVGDETFLVSLIGRVPTDFGHKHLFEIVASSRNDATYVESSVALLAGDHLRVLTAMEAIALASN